MVLRPVAEGEQLPSDLLALEREGAALSPHRLPGVCGLRVILGGLLGRHLGGGGGGGLKGSRDVHGAVPGRAESAAAHFQISAVFRTDPQQTPGVHGVHVGIPRLRH